MCFRMQQWYLENVIGVFEEFVAIRHDRSTSTNKVKGAHLDLFARKQCPNNGIPPSEAALVEHIKISVFQARHTLEQSIC